jgi:2-desacetyl-2-hydroxyethyl bacteriochlorophyllide A dehydrogenase
MKALVCKEPGQFEYIEIDEPVLSPGHAILKITNIGVCGTDLHAFEGKQPYFQYPRILGHELAATIIEPGEAASFERGEAVSFIPYYSCGKCIACRKHKPNCCVQLQVCGVHIDGGMTEYISVPAGNLIHGYDLATEELALIEPLAIGAHGIRRAAIQPGEFALVIGAGPIGIATMQFASLAGAKVIAMDVNENRLAFCRKCGIAEWTINALDTNVEEQLAALTDGDMPTVIIDATGNLAAINKAFGYLAHGGRYVLVGLQKNDISINHPGFHKREATLMSSRNATRQDFELVIDSIRNKRVDPVSLITHRVPFEAAARDFPSWLKQEAGVIKAVIKM